MNLSMQQRDAILAALHLLKCAIEGGATAGFDPSRPEEHPLCDLLTNGGQHQGLNSEQCSELSDLIVSEYPSPEIAPT